MMPFVRTVSICLRHIVMNRFKIMKKFYSSKALLKMAGGGDILLPGSAPAINSLMEVCTCITSHIYPLTARKQLKRCNELAQELPPTCLPHQDGEPR